MRARHRRLDLPKIKRLGIAPLLTALVVSACGGTRADVETGPAPAEVETDPAGADAETGPASASDSGSRLAELEAIYQARMDSARMTVSEADVDFMTGMIGHHAQALIMADLAPTHDASPSIRTLAGRIINAQKDEIALMQGWLSDRGRTVPEVEIDGTTLVIHGAEHAVHMPGMLSPEQMAELDAARGRDFDRLFLTFMIQHHEGAVTMVHELFATDGAALDDVSFKLASDVQVDQLTEIARMKLMLQELTGGNP